jgi:hypothetical protein
MLVHPLLHRHARPGTLSGAIPDKPPQGTRGLHGGFPRTSATKATHVAARHGRMAGWARRYADMSDGDRTVRPSLLTGPRFGSEACLPSEVEDCCVTWSPMDSSDTAVRAHPCAADRAVTAEQSAPHIPDVPHSTLRGYSMGCRCILCKAAKTATTEADTDAGTTREGPTR